jgi:anti-anti-sigma factor
VGDLDRLEEPQGGAENRRPEMCVHRWSQDTILVDLPGGLENQSELQGVIAVVHDRGDCDVVIDFSQVDVVGGACLAGLLELRRLLQAGGHKLTLCSVAPATRGVFTIARLEDLFEFAEDRFAALASVQMIG